MAAELLSTDDDAPALAGAIVYHAGEVCKSADHLWRVLGEVSIPVDGLTDRRQQHKVANGTEPMALVYLYQQIYDLAQSEVADRLETRPSLLKILDLATPPSQQSISYAWDQFSEQTTVLLDAVATVIAQEAVNHGVILEARVPVIPDENDIDEDGDDPTATREHVREHGRKVVELARRHAFGEFDSNRADNQSTRTNRSSICSPRPVSRKAVHIRREKPAGFSMRTMSVTTRRSCE
jgi:hypothetical protein